mgnify:FL=1
MNHIESILHFSRRLDEMKTVLRRTRVIATGQFEDDAQHSWHISAMAVLLADYANEPVNLEKTIKMLLFHDVVELEAGDTFCYDVNANKDKQEREAIAARNIYGRLPNALGEELLSLWEEFERGDTPEARFAAALDRAQPIFNNYYGGGGSWKEHGIKHSQVLARIAPVKDGCAPLYDHVRSLVEEGVHKGWLIDA